MQTGKQDQRREAGQRTRDRLLAASLELLAQQSQDTVTLRQVTQAAGANIAAVSYHFGSLKALCDSALELALERYLDAQLEAMGGLTSRSTLDELAEAFARPMVNALAVGGHDLTIMRTVARMGSDPPQQWDRLTGKFDQTRRDALRVLTATLPDIEESELIFRTRCAAGILNWLAISPLGVELTGKTEEEIRRLLLPVLAGAFHGHSSADRGVRRRRDGDHDGQQQ
jgi:AcrR family transcriptional regulator